MQIYSSTNSSQCKSELDISHVISICVSIGFPWEMHWDIHRWKISWFSLCIVVPQGWTHGTIFLNLWTMKIARIFFLLFQQSSCLFVCLNTQHPFSPYDKTWKTWEPKRKCYNLNWWWQTHNKKWTKDTKNQSASQVNMGTMWSTARASKRANEIGQWIWL